MTKNTVYVQRRRNVRRSPSWWIRAKQPPIRSSTPMYCWRSMRVARIGAID